MVKGGKGHTTAPGLREEIFNNGGFYQTRPFYLLPSSVVTVVKLIMFNNQRVLTLSVSSYPHFYIVTKEIVSIPLGSVPESAKLAAVVTASKCRAIIQVVTQRVSSIGKLKPQSSFS
ncbi:hypothetical protein CTI12_AA281290 [Artemisia annua]|uniref:Uncharacterized protein n=1 Tax=Artemisia annua TaxID=35608 RepID=A0A2U1ND42_ARTAN|nr:hypothetical protein CTI12_AA281290 [Artemisia annua]